MTTTNRFGFPNVTGTDIKVSVSSSPAFFAATYYGKNLELKAAYLTNTFKGGKLTIPAGTPWVVCSFSVRPDVYMLAVHLPEHGQAGTDGLVAVVLREASYAALRDDDALRRQKAEEAEVILRPYHELPSTDINGIRHAPKGFELKFDNPFLGWTKRHEVVTEALPVGTRVGVWVSELGAYRFHTGTLVAHTSRDAKGSLPERYYGDDIAQVTIAFDEPKPWTFDMRTTEDQRDVQLDRVFSAVET